MEEESIYKILDGFKDPAEPALDRTAKTSKASTLTKKPPVLPTASTFINTTSCRPGVGNLAGHRDPTAILQDHKATHATFGLPKGGYRTNPSSSTTGARQNRKTKLLPLIKDDYKENLLPKPAIPRVGEAPIQGLSSNLNFIADNRKRAISLKPKQFSEPANFLRKAEYGRPPTYLETVKATINQEMEYLNMLTQAQGQKPSSRYELPKEEVEELKAALQKRHAEVTKEYQSITHVSKVYSEGIKRKKERCEKELVQIERDLQMLGKDTILVDLVN